MAKSGKGLNDRQRRFVDEYLVDLNATQAAVRSGYSERTAAVIGAENLRKPLIADAIEAAKADRSARVQITKDYVLTNLAEVVERCMQRAPVMVRQGKEMVQLQDDDGNDVWQFDARGAIGALNLVGKHLVMFVERVEHTGKDGVPLQVWAFGGKKVTF